MPSEDEDTAPCPNCGRSMYDDADRCPHCGDYVTPGTVPGARSWPWWIWVGAILALLVLLGWALR